MKQKIEKINIKTKKNIINILNRSEKNLNETKVNLISFDVIMGLKRLKNSDPGTYNMSDDNYNKLLLNIDQSIKYKSDKCNTYLKVIAYLSDENTKKDVLLKYFSGILEIYNDSFKMLKYSLELEKYILSLDIHH